RLCLVFNLVGLVSKAYWSILAFALGIVTPTFFLYFSPFTFVFRYSLCAGVISRLYTCAVYVLLLILFVGGYIQLYCSLLRLGQLVGIFLERISHISQIY